MLSFIRLALVLNKGRWFDEKETFSTPNLVQSLVPNLLVTTDMGRFVWQQSSFEFLVWSLGDLYLIHVSFSDMPFVLKIWSFP
jgi:hypothetical protein